MTTKTHLTNREIIEACADVCGLALHFGEGIWEEGNATKRGRVLADGSTFNPLTDANDAWRVLEAVRKWDDMAARNRFYVQLGTPAGYGNMSFRSILQHWFWNGHFSDIARAAAQAWIESK